MLDDNQQIVPEVEGILTLATSILAALEVCEALVLKSQIETRITQAFATDKTSLMLEKKGSLCYSNSNVNKLET